MYAYEIIAELTKKGLSLEDISKKLGHPAHAVRLGLRFAKKVGAC